MPAGVKLEAFEKMQSHAQDFFIGYENNIKATVKDAFQETVQRKQDVSVAEVRTLRQKELSNLLVVSFVTPNVTYSNPVYRCEIVDGIQKAVKRHWNTRVGALRKKLNKGKIGTVTRKRGRGGEWTTGSTAAVDLLVAQFCRRGGVELEDGELDGGLLNIPLM